MRATLLYNPAAGRNRSQRTQLAESAAVALEANGFQIHLEPTRSRSGTCDQARQAIANGAAAVFACGGDGTVHDVLQGVVGTGAVLGILPAGSANALAQELCIPANPVQAAQSFHPARTTTLRTTRIERAGLPTLYSLCMAGAGPDGELMYRMLTIDRSGAGPWRYYEHALRIFLSHRFHPFKVEVHDTSGATHHHRVISAMTLRIGDLQGVFSGIARGASIPDDALHVVLVRPPARLTLPLWFVLSWLRLGRFHPCVHVSKAMRLSTGDPVPLQVDGEWAGRTAATITLDGPSQAVLIPAQPRA